MVAKKKGAQYFSVFVKVLLFVICYFGFYLFLSLRELQRKWPHSASPRQVSQSFVDHHKSLFIIATNIVHGQ